ncbi:MAG: N-acetylmuramoyl-L-alanine amidase [Bacteroidota bacterium]
MSWLLALNLCFCSQLLSQNAIPVQLSDEEGIYVVDLSRPTGDFWALHLARVGGMPIGQVEYRLIGDGHDHEEWKLLLPAAHSPREDVSGQIFIPLTYSRVAFRLPDAGFQAHLFDPGPTEGIAQLLPIGTSSTDDCIQPLGLIRSDWCPAGTCPEDNTPVATTVTHLPVHHSAGTNTSSDWAAVVRAIWNFHVNTNGWDDIGYNYLIDPEGVIYVGRGEDVRGAHFCGNNTGTMGTCLLGTFTNQAPTEAALASLSQLLAWKLTDNDIDPQLSSFHAASNAVLPHIVPHRDGCATSCPGDSFAPLFDELRQRVADTIASCMVSGTSAGGSLTTDLTVFPNPVSNWVTIQGSIEADLPDNQVDWELLDLFGRPVQTGTWPVSGGRINQRIELGHLAAEVYILKIGSGSLFASFWIAKD